MIDLLLSGGSNWAEAVLVYLLAFAVRATIVLLGALLATRLLRAASAATRHLVWTAAVTAVVALPALTFTLPAWNVPVISFPATLDAPIDSRSANDGPSAPAPAPSAVSRQAVAAATPPASPQVQAFNEAASGAGPAFTWPAVSVDTKDVVAGLWIAIALILVVRLGVANARVLAWRRSSRLVEDVRWLNLMRRLTREHEIERPVVLLESSSTDVPVTWGIVYPVVLIPAAAAEWDEEQRVAVLTHELAHVKRFDALSQMVAQVALALLWFHPLAWLAVRRMRMEREHACDDFVLVSGARASRYADDLLGLARRLARPTAPAAAALAMARRSELEGRLLAILDPTAKRSAVRGARAGVMTLAVVLLAMPLAAFRPAVRVTTAEKPTPVPAFAQTQTRPAPQPTAPRADSSVSAQTPNGPQASTASGGATTDGDRLATLLSAPGSVGSLTARASGLGRVVAAPSLRTVRDTEPDRPVDVQTLVEVAKGAKRMTSDYEKGQLLAQIAKRYVRSDSVRDAYLDAVFSMTSDYEKQKALIALLERDSIPATHTARVLQSAKNMTSDMSRRVILQKIGPSAFADSVVQKAYLDVINGMTSNVDRAQAILPLVKQPGLSQNVQLGLLRVTAAITGNTEKAGVLVAFLQNQGTTDPVVRRAFLRSAETLSSDSEYRRVMMEMMR